MFERTIAQPLVAIGAGADFTFDLPNQPISYIDLCFQGIADQVVTNVVNMFDILGNLQRIDVRYNGADVITLTGQELVMYALAVQGYVPTLTFQDLGNDNAFNLVVRIPFSRTAYSLTECFPATPSGNSQARVIFTNPLTCVDSLSLEVVACRLPTAKPTQFVALDRIIRNIAVLGDNDIFLTVAYPYAGLLVFSGAIPNAGLLTATARYISLFEDSDQTRLHNIPWQHLRGCLNEKSRNFHWVREHVHTIDVVPPVAGDLTEAQSFLNNNYADHWGFIDFDPNLDNAHVLNVSRDHDLLARVNSDVVGLVGLFPIILKPVSSLKQ